jgi:penicillin amidase
MRKVGDFLKRGLIAILALGVIASAGAGYYFKSYLPNTIAPKSFPIIDGQIQLAGLDAPVDIYRDPMGIPNIYASTEHDLFFAQGYVHAQERFWQMDAWRHIGSGTLSEMFGKGRVDTDTFLRTLGWRRVAEQEYNELEADSQSILISYTEGVNAFLKDHDATDLSLEYAVLGLLSPDYKIEPWTPVNSLTWGKAMAWDLRGNMGKEIERAVMLKTLSPEHVAELYPPYPQDHPSIVNKIGENPSPLQGHATQTLANLTLSSLELNSLTSKAALLDGVLSLHGDGIGSNSWVIGGTRTATGMPLLANDPHLGIQMPSIWFQLGLHCKPKSDACPYDVAGFSFAGVPGVVIGHNDRIAWGVTNLGPDVMDLYVEKVNPNDPNQYEVNGQWVDFETRKETINIVGGEPVEITVKLTRHGPVISDSYGPLEDHGDPKDKEFEAFKDRAGIELPEQYVIALRWTALSPSTPFKAIWGFDKAKNWQDFREAAKYFHVPAQNLTYADIDGNIGYQMPGDIPVRANGDGTLPVPGWTDEFEWTGLIPFEDLPYALNPHEDYIATANNQVVPSDYPYLITEDWEYGFRAQRIVDLIMNAPGKIDIAYIQKMQGDNYEPNAATLIPLLMELDLDSDLIPARDLLKGWDSQASANSAPAALFESFWRMVLKNTFQDDLPERYWPTNGSNWNEIVRNLVKKPDHFFWDDKATENAKETRDEILARSFREAVAELNSELGRDMSKWSWGQLHTSTFRNGTLGNSGIGLIEALFNRGPFPTSGGQSIVNATAWYSNESYEVTDLPSLRAIYDLSDFNRSVTVHTTGQSGHAYHKHYDDMASLWVSIQYYQMLWKESSVTQHTEGHLVLKPK